MAARPWQKGREPNQKTPPGRFHMLYSGVSLKEEESPRNVCRALAAERAALPAADGQRHRCGVFPAASVGSSTATPPALSLALRKRASREDVGQGGKTPLGPHACGL